MFECPAQISHANGYIAAKRREVKGVNTVSNKRTMTLDLMKQIYIEVDDVINKLVKIANLNNKGNSVIIGDKIVALSRKLHSELIRIEDKFYRDNEFDTRVEYDRWLHKFTESKRLEVK